MTANVFREGKEYEQHYSKGKPSEPVKEVGKSNKTGTLVTFTPDKWQALSLTSEYYRGTLRFIVGGHAHVSVPALGNYSFEAKFDDIEVNTNDPSLDDTHLCACPGWKKPGHH